ncbi:alpha/beta hydrolase family protein [Aquimarina pacifica]|uniref:hypothetical protein n=1 Tax=Aquimarina pacifica TaxID=1296415 RepID=UPI000471F8CE|nr:hypothetical protein [Aquimarina pacifica]
MSGKEDIICFGKNNVLVGVLNRDKDNFKADSPCVIFINAGVIPKCGPNRLYVKTARELSRIGIVSFRFDYSSMGDSGKTNIEGNFQEVKDEEIRQAMNVIQKKTGIKNFVLSGICSGAEDAFRNSLLDHRIVGLVLVDGIYGDKSLLKDVYPIANRNLSIRYYKKNAFDLNRWKKVLNGNSNVLSAKNFKMVANMGANTLKKMTGTSKKESNSEQEEIPTDTIAIQKEYNLKDWELLFTRNVKSFLIFCEGGIAIDIFNLSMRDLLTTYNKTDFLHVKLMENIDHTFTPQWSQNVLTEMIVDWIGNNFMELKEPKAGILKKQA